MRRPAPLARPENGAGPALTESKMRDDEAGGGKRSSPAVLLAAAAACSTVAALLALNIASAGAQREVLDAPPRIEQPAAGPAHAMAAPSRR